MANHLLLKIKKMFLFERNSIKVQYNRTLPFGDCINDRWEKAEFLGFGKNSSVYDNVVVLGEPEVGENTWVGPNVILDASGGLEIGSNCSISAGVQIYSHDSVQWALSAGKEEYEYGKTSIGDNCYIGPNVIIQKGVRIGNSCIIGANSFVNRDIPDCSKAFGTPVVIKEEITV